jgi:hypothetical protein
VTRYQAGERRPGTPVPTAAQRNQILAALG